RPLVGIPRADDPRPFRPAEPPRPVDAVARGLRRIAEHVRHADDGSRLVEERLEAHPATLGSTWPCTSPRVIVTPSPTVAWPRSATWSPSSRNRRSTPPTASGSAPPRVSSTRLPSLPRVGPDTVPEARRSPVRRWAPFAVRWATCCGNRQYRPAKEVELMVVATSAPAGWRSTASVRSRAHGSARSRYGSGGGSCTGPAVRQS